MAQTATRRRPGRPRELPTPVKMGIRIKPELYRRMDAYLVTVSQEQDTQRSLVERAIEQELNRIDPEGGTREHHSRGIGSG